MYYSKESIELLCKKHAIALKKRWGQNFLIHEPTLDTITTTVFSLCNNTQEQGLSLWEIGPGLGTLSYKILQEKHLKSLTVFEIDRGLVNILKKDFSEYIAQQRMGIVEGDALVTLGITTDSVLPNCIYGNLPYSIGVKILLRIVEHAYYVPMCVMLQKEAAERIAARHGTKQYGISSVVLQSIYDISMEYTVPRAYFHPYAHVDSVVCTLKVKDTLLLSSQKQIKTLLRLVKHAFSARRKQLKNTLYMYLCQLDNAKYILDNTDIDWTLRAENISVEQYCRLALLCMEDESKR